jgi:sulfite reductase (NADPH) hemoprotein beta-component
MYIYDQHDQQLLNERVAQFKNQMERYLAGKIPEEEFLPLRLQNGIYVQRYAPNEQRSDARISKSGSRLR